MAVFNYLEDDNANISQSLTETAKNYSQWTRDRIFEKAKAAFASIKEHFSKEAIVENNLKDETPISNLLSEVSRQRKEIAAEIDQIVEIHVDEPGFEQALETIAKKFNEYAQYCKEKYYTGLKKILTQDELKHIQEQFDQKILS